MENNEEISLVDLLAVLVRWRRLVFAPVLLAVLAAAVGFGLRFYARQDGAEPRRLETVLTIMPAPGPSSFIGAGVIESMVTRLLDEPSSFDAALRAAGITKLNGLGLESLEDARRYFALRQLFVLQQNLDGGALGKDAWLFSRSVDRGLIRLSFAHPDPAAAAAFLIALIGIVDLRVRDLSRPLADAQIQDYERLMMKPDTSDSEDEILAKDFSSYTAAKRFVGGTEPSLAPLHEPYRFDPSPSREERKLSYLKMAALAAFAAGFLGVLLAFLAQSVSSIRADKAAMGKLKDAWYKR